MHRLPLILASASPRRAELLRQAGFKFQVIASPGAELVHDQLTARELCLLNAYRKARAVARQHPDAIVLGADTLVCLGDELFGKPANRSDAERMFQRLQGRTHQVVTGVCLVQLRAHRERIFAETTAVVFKRLDRAQIRDYLALVNPLDKAGAYGIQDHGELIVETISGSLTNVIGLPMERLQAELKDWPGPAGLR